MDIAFQPGRRWPADDEARAVSAEVVFAEWLAATGIASFATITELRGWARREPVAFYAALAGFAGDTTLSQPVLQALAGLLFTVCLRADDVLTWSGADNAPALIAARLIGARVAPQTLAGMAGVVRLDRVPPYP